MLFFLFLGCSSSKLVDQYLNPETPDYKAQKILVVGLTPDGGLQRQFEYSLVKALQDQHVNAIKSVDVFGEPFIISEDSTGHWENLESQLVDAGFDAVLFSKITGKETKVTLAQSYRNLVRTFETFSEYYNENTQVREKGAIEDYPVLNTETSLYCLCPDRENDLVWRGNIDIVNSPGAQKSIRDYVRTLMQKLKENHLLVGN